MSTAAINEEVLTTRVVDERGMCEQAGSARMPVPQSPPEREDGLHLRPAGHCSERGTRFRTDARTLRNFSHCAHATSVSVRRPKSQCGKATLTSLMTSRSCY